GPLHGDPLPGSATDGSPSHSDPLPGRTTGGSPVHSDPLRGGPSRSGPLRRNAAAGSFFCPNAFPGNATVAHPATGSAHLCPPPAHTTPLHSGPLHGDPLPGSATDGSPSHSDPLPGCTPTAHPIGALARSCSRRRCGLPSRRHAALAPWLEGSGFAHRR